MSLPIACASSSTVICCFISTSPLVSGNFFLFFFFSYMELDIYIGTYGWHKLRNSKNNIKETMVSSHIFLSII